MQLIWNGLIDAARLVWGRDPLVLDAAWRSLWVSALSVTLAAAVGVTIGSILARRRLPGRRLTVVAFRAAMGFPTVLIGLLGYAMLSRRGPLGGYELLYTPWAIVIGEFFLALPIIVTWTHDAIGNLDPRIGETARTLGAGLFRRWGTYLSEQRRSIALAFLTAFARCFTELGIATMVGGNIKYRTRTLATATALETARGEFSRGVAMGLLLLVAALVVAAIAGCLIRSSSE
jgi:tungstate transport system permease protein